MVVNNKEYIDKKSQNYHSIKSKINILPHDIINIYLYEGTDDILFYNHHIRQKHGNKINALKCHGKENVLKLQKDYDFKHRKPLFFIDKDFDDYLGKTYPQNDNLFVTQGYSFENYLVTSIALSILLQDIADLSLHDSKAKNYLEKYEHAYHTFINAMKSLMELAVNCHKNKKAINLNNIDYKNFCSFFTLSHDLEVFFNENYLDEFKRLTQSETAINTLIIFDIFEHNKWLRGKYAIFFLRKFFDGIQNQLKIKDKINNDRDLIKFLSPRIPIPSNLDKFLSHHVH
jgi:hypothetical protein